MTTVILEREPYLHNLKWRDGDARAYERTMALCELHSCNYTQYSGCVVVHGSEAYKPRGER